MSDSAVATPVAEKGKHGRKPIPEGLKSPSPIEFALIYNASSSRQDAVKRFAAQNFHMSYGSVLARVKSYTDPTREGGVIKLKDMPQGQRGRHVDAAEVNAAIEAAANAQTVLDAAGGEKPA